jgi:hypothetical protein
LHVSTRECSSPVVLVSDAPESPGASRGLPDATVVVDERPAVAPGRRDGAAVVGDDAVDVEVGGSGDRLRRGLAARRELGVRRREFPPSPSSVAVAASAASRRPCSGTWSETCPGV